MTDRFLLTLLQYGPYPPIILVPTPQAQGRARIQMSLDRYISHFHIISFRNCLFLWGYLHILHNTNKIYESTESLFAAHVKVIKKRNNHLFFF